jgi:formylglycine-generating enzyme required for sulfatase activity
MLPIPGNSGAAWHHSDPTTTTTTDAIPDLTMSETQITQAQFEYVFPDRGGLASSSGGNYFACSTNPDYAPSSAKPADNINWYAAIAYCNKLSAMEGKDLCYSVTVDGDEVDWKNLTYADIPGNSGNNTDWNAATCDFTKNGYRLPTSSEWEYAARGGTANTSPVYSGSTFSGSGDDTAALGAVGWYSGNSSNQTHNVRGKAANSFGLCDMSGNVWEWCWNWYNETFPQATPTGSTASTGSSTRVLRGGSWSNLADYCRVSYRNYNYPYIPEQQLWVSGCFPPV